MFLPMSLDSPPLQRSHISLLPITLIHRLRFSNILNSGRLEFVIVLHRFTSFSVRGGTEQSVDVFERNTLGLGQEEPDSSEEEDVETGEEPAQGSAYSTICPGGDTRVKR